MVLLANGMLLSDAVTPVQLPCGLVPLFGWTGVVPLFLGSRALPAKQWECGEHSGV